MITSYQVPLKIPRILDDEDEVETRQDGRLKVDVLLGSLKGMHGDSPLGRAEQNETTEGRNNRDGRPKGDRVMISRSICQQLGQKIER